MLRFVIPAYNEEQNIKTLLENTRRFCENKMYDYQVIIINDGSTDGTMRILNDYKKIMPMVVLDQVTNKGVGAAFLRGFVFVADNAGKEDLIITKEADNTSDLTVLENMLQQINQGYDLVLASCYMSGGSVIGASLYRRILSLCANSILKIFTPLKGIHTFSSFYRVYRAETIKQMYSIFGDRMIEEKGFTCMAEILIKLIRLNIKITEVPMVLKGNLRKGKSKMKTLRTIIAYIKLLFNFHINRDILNR